MLRARASTNKRSIPAARHAIAVTRYELRGICVIQRLQSVSSCLSEHNGNAGKPSARAR